MPTLTQDDLQTLRDLKANLDACILGKSKEILLLLTALFAEGHVLVEDVPGTGKTVLIKALAKSIRGQYRRIQCNPDLLPTDITGVSIFHPKDETFVFRPGPVMTNILLIDEINRATTKTQSALLEAMEERSVTVDGEAHELPSPFILLATQNPIDFEGTYSLPEAQLDRFMLKFSLGYPDEETERRMVRAQSQSHPLDGLQPVTGIAAIVALQHKAKAIHISETIHDYIVSIVRKTRESENVYLGASPRATLAVMQAAKAFAMLHERDFVTPDDVKDIAPHILNHRIILTAEARLEGRTPQSVLNGIFQQVRVPVGMEK